MQTKLAAVLVREAGGDRPLPVTVICRELGISRQTYYKLRRRFAEDGVDGLMARSRRPHHSPRQLSAAEEDAVVAAFKWLEEDGWDYGAISIQARLKAQAVTGLGDSQPDELPDSEPDSEPVVALDRVPSLRTIHRVLHRRGLAPPQPNKRTRSSGRRFEFPASNDCWQIDAFEHHLATGAVVVVFELLDDHSRLLLANLAWPSEDGTGAWTVVASAIAVFGPPRMFLSDNSLAFSGARRGRQVQFETNLRALGIKPITSRPYHPRTCGKNERHHQTSQRWLRRRPVAETLEQLQTQLDTYLEAYNTKRPHQGIGMATPAARYKTGQRNRPDTGDTDSGSGSGTDSSTETASTTCTDHTVNARGQIRLAGTAIGLGSQWTGCTVTVFRAGSHVLVFHRDDLVRELTIDPTRSFQPTGQTRGGRRRTRHIDTIN
jgi:transposase InsO family protein